MKILSSDISMASSHYKTEQYKVEEKARFWIGNNPDFSNSDFISDSIQISDYAKNLLESSSQTQCIVYNAL